MQENGRKMGEGSLAFTHSCQSDCGSVWDRNGGEARDKRLGRPETNRVRSQTCWECRRKPGSGGGPLCQESTGAAPGCSTGMNERGVVPGEGVGRYTRGGPESMMGMQPGDRRTRRMGHGDGGRSPPSNVAWRSGPYEGPYPWSIESPRHPRLRDMPPIPRGGRSATRTLRLWDGKRRQVHHIRWAARTLKHCSCQRALRRQAHGG